MLKLFFHWEKFGSYQKRCIIKDVLILASKSWIFSTWNTKWVKIELYLDLKLTLEVDFFFQKIFKNFNRKPYYHKTKFHQEKDLYFSFHYVLKKRRSNFSFYISLYYTEVLISLHTWLCIVNCYWWAKKQHREVQPIGKK